MIVTHGSREVISSTPNLAAEGLAEFRSRLVLLQKALEEREKEYEDKARRVVDLEAEIERLRAAPRGNGDGAGAHGPQRGGRQCGRRRGCRWRQWPWSGYP
mgnify:CR=1 FL=1